MCLYCTVLKTSNKNGFLFLFVVLSYRVAAFMVAVAFFHLSKTHKIKCGNNNIKKENEHK